MNVPRYEPMLYDEVGIPFIRMEKCSHGEYVEAADYERLYSIYSELVEKIGELWRAY